MHLRTPARLVALALLAATLLGCSSSDGTSTTAAPSDAPVVSDGAFPVTVDSAYGEVTVDAPPKKIVALGAQHVDILVSLGHQPAAYTDGRSTDRTAMEANHPWLAGKVTGTYDASLVTTEYKAALQAIAVHQPDLILANTWLLDEATYRELSKVAPTFVGTVVGNNDWDDLVTSVGTLTGSTEAADTAIAEVARDYEAAKTKLPGLQGKTYQYVSYGSQTFAYGNGSWAEGLGLVPAPGQVNTASGGDVASDISRENIEQLDADVLWIWDSVGEIDEVEGDPRFAELPSSLHGTATVFDTPRALASNSAGPQSLRWLIAQVLPELEGSELNTADS